MNKLESQPYEKTNKVFLEGYYANIDNIPFDDNKPIEWKKGYRTIEEERVGMDLEGLL